MRSGYWPRTLGAPENPRRHASRSYAACIRALRAPQHRTPPGVAHTGGRTGGSWWFPAVDSVLQGPADPAVRAVGKPAAGVVRVTAARHHSRASHILPPIQRPAGRVALIVVDPVRRVP